MAKIFFLVTFCLLSAFNNQLTTSQQEQSNDLVNVDCDIQGVQDDFFCNITESCDVSSSVSIPKWLQNETVVVGSSVACLKSVQVTGIDHYMLNISWTFVNFDTANWTQAFLLHFKNNDSSNNRELQAKGDDDCYFLDFQNSLFQDMPTFRLSTPVYANTTYNMTITSLPSKDFLTYSINIPPVPSQDMINENTSLSNWTTLLAVGADHYNKRLYIFFEPAPDNMEPTKYSVSVIVDAFGRFPSIMQPIEKQQENITMPVIVEYGTPNVYYSIQVKVYGAEQCQDGCYVSRPVYLEDVPIIPVQSTHSTPTSVNGITVTTDNYTPFIKPKVTTPAPESSKNVGVIVGVIAGVILLAAVIIILLCAYNKRNKHSEPSYPMKRLNNDQDTDSKVPSVLLLYSYDCPAHEQVVIEFANFLRNEWHLEVHLDLWQQKDIVERGDVQWLNEKLIMSQFVIIVSSTGARYKCARNRQFRMKYDRPVPDMFTHAVDLVLERCRASKLELNQENNNNCSSAYPSLECVVVCFSYSCASDVPPKLDTHPRFLLVKELYEFYCHLCRTKPLDKPPPSFNAVSPSRFKQTKLGKQFHMVLTKANDFFKNNPDWLAEVLEPVSPPSIVPVGQQNQSQQQQQQNQQHQQNDSQPDPNVHSSNDIKGDIIETNDVNSNKSSSPNQNGTSSSSHSRMPSNLSASEDDALLEERKQKRLKEEESKMDRIASSSKLKDIVSYTQSGNDSTFINMNPDGNGTSTRNDVGTFNGEINSNGLSVPLVVNSDKISLRSNHSRNNSDYSSLTRSIGNTNSLNRSGGNTGSLNQSNGNKSTGLTDVQNNNDNSLSSSQKLGNESNDNFKSNGVGNDIPDVEVDLYNNADDEAEQLQRDIDFILQWDRPCNPADILLDMDFTGYTPPENVPLSLTYKNFGLYNNNNPNKEGFMNSGFNTTEGSATLNFQGPNLDFTNPLYCNVNGEAGDYVKNNQDGVDLMLNGFGPPKMKKSDKNDNFIIDFEIPAEKVEQMRKNRVQSLRLSESSDAGTNL